MRSTAWTMIWSWLLVLSLLGGCKRTSLPGVASSIVHPFLEGVIAAEAGTLFRGVFSPDGAEFYFFRKVSEDGEDYRVFRIQREGAAWSAPSLLTLADGDASNLYPAISPDGKLIVFSSYRPVDEASHNVNLWAARREGAGWGEPFQLDHVSTIDNYDAGPWFGPDGDLRFTSTSPDWATTWQRMASPSGGSYGPWREDTSWADFDIPEATHHFWTGVINQTRTLAVLEVSERKADGSLAGSDLWLSRWGNGGWSPPVPLGPEVNTEGTENFATFVPGGSTLVFVRNFSIFLSVRVSELH